MRSLYRITLVASVALAQFVMFEGQALAACSVDPNNTHMKAYDGLSCTSTLLLDSGAGVGSLVSVARDRTSSGTNNSSNKWCGVNETFFNDKSVFIWGAHTAANDIGSASNKIDHFDVVGATAPCKV